MIIARGKRMGIYPHLVDAMIACKRRRLPVGTELVEVRSGAVLARTKGAAYLPTPD